MTKEALHEEWRQAVTRLARSVHRRYPSVEVGDIEGAAWIFLYERQAQVESHGWGVHQYLASHLNQFCAKELQAMRDAHTPVPDVATRYTIDEMATLVKVALQPWKRERVSPEWEAKIQTVEKALESLCSEDRELLRLRYLEEEPLRVSRERLDVSTATVSKRARALLEQLLDIIEGSQEEDGHWADRYEASNGTISNAQARARLSRDYES